jgi:subtilase family serine protease
MWLHNAAIFNGMEHMKRTNSTLTVLTVVGALAATGLMGAPAQAAPNKHRIARTAPGWVAGTKAIGNAPAKELSSFRVYLAPQGGLAALKADVAKVSNPSSASYRHFLTAPQFHAKYDATAATATKVSSWLKDNGLDVTSVEAHRRYLTVEGSNAQVEKAFSVAMKRYKHQGRTVEANSSAVAVPESIASVVMTVTGLDTTPPVMKHHAPPPDGFRNGRPCSRFYGQVKASTQADFKTPLPKFKNKVLPYAVCGYTGPQYRAAYQGANPKGLDGKGVTVAITDAYAAPTIAQDAQKYGTTHGDGGYASGQLVQTVPSKFKHQADCDPSGWYGEETLDVEAVHAMAPAAKIHYYGAASCFDEDFLATLGQVVDDNQASLVSNSWGDLEENETTENVAAYEQIFLQGAMQGTGFLFSSGDDGDELASSVSKQTDYPTSDPYVTSVGGTSDAIGQDGSFLFQTGWGTVKYSLSDNQKAWNSEGFLYGAGGGASGLFNQPSYQKGVVPGSNGAGRGVPDVGLDGDPNTGMLVGETQTFPDGVYYDEYRIGGTSLATPLFAGMTALLSQNAKGRLGFLNPLIYKNAGSSRFNDVKGTPADAGNVRSDFANGLDAADGLLYSVRTFDQDSSLALKRGWDNITGVGSPNAGWLTTPVK